MTTMLSGLCYAFKQTFQQIFRNFAMMLASIFCMTAMLGFLGLFCTLTVNVNVATDTIEDQFDSIEVFLLDDTSLSEAEKMSNSILAMDEVTDVQFISKTQAMEDFKGRFGNNAYLLDGLSVNPLPNSLRVQLRSLEDGDFVAEVCKNLVGVEDVRYYQTEVNKILKVADLIKKASLIFIAVSIVVSIIVIANTIKLTVMARQKEIEIMKYVGATHWFVRGPMFIEGILIGLISAGIALGVSALVYQYIINSYSDQISLLMSMELVDFNFMVSNLAWIFAVIGLTIGAIASIFSMRKYLKV